MSTKLNRDAYQKLVDENIAWLEKQPKTLERDHSIDIVRSSVRFYYDADAQLAESAASEVQLREAMGDAEDFVCVIESLAMDGDRSRISEVAGNAQSRVHRALAAPPSTAAAELVLGRAAFEWCSRFPDSQAAQALAGELAAVAAARAVKP